MKEAVQVEPDHPVLIDQYLENAVEVDVDALCDHEGTVVIGGLMEHIEPAGIHSGDSACCLPSISLSEEALALIRHWSEALATTLKVQGLINLQFAVQRAVDGEEKVFIIEANPRASRTVPFVPSFCTSSERCSQSGRPDQSPARPLRSHHGDASRHCF